MRPLLAMLSQQSTVSPPARATRRCIEPAHKPAEGRAWWVAARKVGPDIRMGEIEITRRWVMTVALFRDGESDDPRRGGGDPGEQRVPIFGREERLAENADHAHPLVRAVVLDQRVETILRPERVAHGSAAQAGTAIAQEPGTTASARWVRIA